MHLLYLDDSGAVGNANEQYLVLGGVSVLSRRSHTGSHRSWTGWRRTSTLDDPHSVEFHASETFSSPKPAMEGPEPGRSTRHDQVRPRRTGERLRHGPSIRFVSCTRTRFRTGTRWKSPSRICAADSTATCNDCGPAATRSGGRFCPILDKTTLRARRFSGCRSMFRTLGTRWARVIRHLADTPFFVDSHQPASRVIQLADHVAHAVFRRYEVGDTQYFDRIAHKFDAEDGDRSRRTGPQGTRQSALPDVHRLCYSASRRVPRQP